MFSFLKKIFFNFCGGLLFLMACCHPLLAQETGTKKVQERVTVDSYFKFLEEVGSTDAHQLYDPKMAYDPPMINRDGPPGAYHYSIPEDADPNGPILYVNKAAQARYLNWKVNKNTESGIYHLSAMNNDPSAPLLAAPDATYLLHSDSNLDPTLSLGNGPAAWFMVDRITAIGSSSEAPPSTESGLSPGLSVKEGDSSFSDTFSSINGNDEKTQKLTSMRAANPLSITKNPNPIKIDLAVIDDPGNAYDNPKYGALGSVKTVFQMASNDVTAQQYCAFLNSVATNEDPYKLYDSRMTSDSNIACITRTAGSTNYNSNHIAIPGPPFSYAPIPGREQLPITYVSGASAARFCNWMENGQPIGVEGPETTERGSFEIIYTTNCTTNYVTNPPTRYPNGTVTPGNVVTNVVSDVLITVNLNEKALWSIATEDQWYKAAYYKKATVGMDGFTNNDQLYYCYGTGSDEFPQNSIELADQTNNDVNFCVDGQYTMSNAPYITPVGMFKKTKSPFGLYDMSGNVDQWVLYPVITPTGSTEWCFALRGGSWKSTNVPPPWDGSVTIKTGEIGSTSKRRLPPIPVGGDTNNLAYSFLLTTNTIGFRLVYNAPPPPPDLMQEMEAIGVKMAARFWTCLKTTADSFSLKSMAHDLADASINLYHWGFGLIYPELAKGVLLRLIGKRVSVTAASGTSEAATATEVTGAAAESAGVLAEATEAAEVTALIMPPPLDVLVPAGIVLGGLTLAYYQSNVGGAQSAFGVVLDGLGLFQVLRALF